MVVLRRLMSFGVAANGDDDDGADDGDDYGDGDGGGDDDDYEN